MRKILCLTIIFLLFIISFVGCVSNEQNPDNDDITEEYNNTTTNNAITDDTTTNNTSQYTIDYEDAKTFEKALNSGEKVNGKIVRFDVIAYKPYSGMGINCWSGEHLNFISEVELDVDKGDIIVGRITAEPIEELGSWRVPYEVIKINPDDEKFFENSTNNETTKTTTVSSDEKLQDSVKDEPEKTRQLFYSTNDYETAKKGNTGVFSYKNKNGSYDIYWIIDFDAGYVYWFTDGNGETTCDKVKIVSGSLNDRITVTWHDSGNQWSWYLHFKYKNHPETLVINDHNGIVTEFTTTDLDDALKVRNTKTIKEY